ncbi:MAG: type II toxin-antitoxin system VapC family toxin [Bacteroidaceae bacterium]|nr:type II toxin-antitoxin system VapC family toxin [Bacteroidaceae bacterium]
MRYLLDTNIYIYFFLDREQLSRDVRAILEDYDNTFCISSETVRELIVGFNNGGIVSRFWKTAKEMVDSIRNLFFIEILPVGAEQMETYSRLEINHQEKHYDPSDHVIISHAITNGIPLISSDRKFQFYRKQGLELIYNKR